MTPSQGSSGGHDADMPGGPSIPGCPICGHDIEKPSEACPSCGHPVGATSGSKFIGFWIFWLLYLVCVVLLLKIEDLHGKISTMHSILLDIHQ